MSLGVEIGRKPSERDEVPLFLSRLTHFGLSYVILGDCGFKVPRVIRDSHGSLYATTR